MPATCSCPSKSDCTWAAITFGTGNSYLAKAWAAWHAVSTAQGENGWILKASLVVACVRMRLRSTLYEVRVCIRKAKHGVSVPLDPGLQGRIFLTTQPGPESPTLGCCF